MAEKTAPALPAADPRSLDRLEADHANFRAALDWAEQVGEIDLQLALTTALQEFWSLRGHYAEGGSWMERMLAHETRHTPRRATALGMASLFAWIQGDCERAQELAEERLALCQELGDIRGESRSLSDLGTLAVQRGEFAQARQLYEQSLELLRDRPTDDDELRLASARTLASLGDMMLNLGEHTEAQRVGEEALAIFLDIGEQQAVADSMSSLGFAALRQQRLNDALELFRESLAISGEPRMLGSAVCALIGLAATAHAQDDNPRAVTILGASAQLVTKIGLSLGPTEAAARDETLTSTREQLGDAEFTIAFDRGRAMSFEDAVEHAIEA
jgi:non-specific serine/threonine protein kinase